MYAMAAPLLFPHVPEWGGLGAALFSGCSRSARELLCRTKGALLATFVGVKAARALAAPKKGAAPGPPHSETCGNSNGAAIAYNWARPGAQT